MKKILLIAGLLLLMVSCNADFVSVTMTNDSANFYCTFNNSMTIETNITYDLHYYIQYNDYEDFSGFATDGEQVPLDKQLSKPKICDGLNWSCDSNITQYNSTSMIATDEFISVIFSCNGSTTTTTSTSSSTSTSGPTTSTSSGTTSSSGGTSSSSVAPSSAPGTTLYGYSLPYGDHGTLPGLNGTGGNTINNGSLKNMPCTGFCIIGLKKEEFQLYAAIMIVILVLISIKPFKLGALSSAFALLFFNNIMGWTAITGSLMLIFVFIAVATWWLEGKQ